MSDNTKITENHEKVLIYSDGACSGNPGPGGWGVVIVQGKNKKSFGGGELNTTNNRMELLAVINALQKINAEAQPHIYTDSRYVHDGATKWMQQWKKRKWKKSDKKPVLNVDLWQKIDYLLQNRQVEWHWVKAHDGNPLNEEADKVARQSIPKK